MVRKSRLTRRGRQALVRQPAGTGPALAVKPGAAYQFTKSGVVPKLADFYEHMARASYGLFCDVVNPRQPVAPSVAATAVRASTAVRGHLDGYFRQHRKKGARA